MRKMLLAVGIACATMMAVAQSDARQDNSAQATDVASPRDAATGQASGRRMHKPVTLNESTEELQKQNVVHRDLAARETGSGMATGKTMASDDWNAQQKTKNSMSNAQSNPMYQESGNSGTNPLFQGNERNATKTRSNIQNNRVATGDVDGDGTADAAVSPKPAPVQMKGDFSRGHQPDRTAATTNGKTARETGSGMATGKRQQQ